MVGAYRDFSAILDRLVDARRWQEVKELLACHVEVIDRHQDADDPSSGTIEIMLYEEVGRDGPSAQNETRDARVVDAGCVTGNGRLPDQDSNLEQTGYTDPRVSAGSGLSHHPRPKPGGRVWGARGWLIGSAPHHLVSAPSRLLRRRSSSSAQGCRHPGCCGFPEFTPFSISPLGLTLRQRSQPVALPLSYRGIARIWRAHFFVAKRAGARKSSGP